MLRVIVILEFNGINDADGEQASNITDSITDECLILQHELGASTCYVDDVVVEVAEKELDWSNTRASWDGEDWNFTGVPVEAGWDAGTTCFSPSELGNCETPEQAINALKSWVQGEAK